MNQFLNRVCSVVGRLGVLASVLMGGPSLASAVDASSPWIDAVLLMRDQVAKRPGEGTSAVLARFEKEFPVQWDWLLQDDVADAGAYFALGGLASATTNGLHHALQQLGARAGEYQGQAAQLISQKVSFGDRRWLELYDQVCQARRQARLEAIPAASRRIVFTRHHNLGGSHYAYTEGQSDAQDERHFNPGAALCMLEFVNGVCNVRTLLKDDHGVIRDPAVSYDGKRVMFAWKKSETQDDYHLYEVDVESGKIRQLTEGLGVADYEGAYLPNGDIVFNSTRCVQTVDCWWTEVSNLYTCDKDGHYVRRLTFDQVHDNYPTVLDDSRIIYTRWEYNDRGQIFPQPLYQMNSDGTGQAEFYGNNSWFPTSILHARGIPGTQKVMAIASGHHTMQAGKLIVIDPLKGRQEAAGVRLIAPLRETTADHTDAYGQDGELFQYPYPLSEDACLVSYHPLGWHERADRFYEPHFKLYLMMTDGQRELLVGDPANSCNQPVVLSPRVAAVQRVSSVDYRKNTGVYYMQNVYAGEALPGIKPGTIKRLRVVGLDFRAAGIGHNGSSGPAGGALSSTPPAIDNGSWDPKIVLGDATVYEDGSALFEVPARMPLYFQALDQNGRVVQTMRSWSTLQPGETASCVGCHEDKNASVPSALKPMQAFAKGPERLAPFYGPARAFSFSTEIQPILNAHCVQCHKDRSARGPKSSHVVAEAKDSAAVQTAFSLLGEPQSDAQAARCWSDAYLALTGSGKMRPLVNWVGAQSVPTMLPPYFAGSARSGLIEMLEKGHHKIQLSREEMDKLSCWIDLMVPYCGDYTEAASWTADEVRKYDRYLHKRRVLQEREHAQLEALNAARYGEQPSVRIDLVDAGGKVVREDRPFQAGDRLEISGPTHMMIRQGTGAPESLIYSPNGRVVFPIPLGTSEAQAFAPDAFAKGKSGCSARPATASDLHAYRNLAVNPWDVRGRSESFPHATSNSECRNEPVFAARNAIDGSVDNTKHGGWPVQSWGPDQRTDLWWKVDFGRPVEVDKLVVYIRADFPHDKHWKAATVRFSDGSTMEIEIRKTAEPQVFTFAKRQVSWIQLDGLQQENPLGWCALTEVEVYGTDSSVAETAVAAR